MQEKDWGRVWKKMIDKKVKMVAVEKWKEDIEVKVTMK